MEGLLSMGPNFSLGLDLDLLLSILFILSSVCWSWKNKSPLCRQLCAAGFLPGNSSKRATRYAHWLSFLCRRHPRAHFSFTLGFAVTSDKHPQLDQICIFSSFANPHFFGHKDLASLITSYYFFMFSILLEKRADFFVLYLWLIWWWRLPNANQPLI